MRKNIFFVLLFLGFSGNILWGQETPKGPQDPELDAFVKEFVEAAKDGNRRRLMGLMDPGYRMEQHDKFHEGNTKRFLDELFCGSLIDGSGFKCIKIKNIKDVELASLGEGDRNVAVVFRVSDKKSKIDVVLTIKIRLENGKREFGIVGGVG